MSISLRLLVISDAFGSLVQNAIKEHMDAVQESHALVLLGDLPSVSYPIIRQELKLNMLGLCVLGNHDGDNWTDWLPRYKFQHLHLKTSTVKIDGCEIAFAGMSGSERYKNEGRWQWHDHEAHSHLKDFPYTDILMTHTTDAHPDGILDDHRHRGLPAIGKYIEKQQPYLALHGHFHKNYQKRIGRTQVIGCYGAVLLNCTIESNVWQVDVKPLVTFPWTT